MSDEPIPGRNRAGHGPQAGLRKKGRHRLHWRLFAWFGLTILATAVVVGFVMKQVGGPRRWRSEGMRVKKFVAHRFADVWTDPPARDRLAQSMSDELQVRLELLDKKGEVLGNFGGPCAATRFEVPVNDRAAGGRDRDGPALGTVKICVDRDPFVTGFRWLLPLLAAAAVIWIMSGMITHHLARPLLELAKVAERIGYGDLKARAQLKKRESLEVAMLGEAMHKMASRIEEQLTDQRRLLAMVSHEMRTPLGHLRILSELLAERGADAKTVQALSDEIVEMDRLVGDLLANARLDFSAIKRTRLDAVELAKRALERAGLDPGMLVLGPDTSAQVGSAPTAVDGDPTLLARALANLIDNAQRHGRGLDRLVVYEPRPGYIAFAAEDRGPGFAPYSGADGGMTTTHPDTAPASPTPYHRDAHEGLGLGLDLVARIAKAHGGELVIASREAPESRQALASRQTPESRQTLESPQTPASRQTPSQIEAPPSSAQPAHATTSEGARVLFYIEKVASPSSLA